MSPPTQLRPAVANDAEQVATIYISSWNDGFGELLGFRVLDDGQIMSWADDLTSANTMWFVAEVQGAVAGFAGVGPSRDPVDPRIGELDTIAVSPPGQRQGVGRVLMAHAHDRMRAQWNEAILWTPANYERGHAFYRAMGWNALGRSRASGSEVAFGRHF